MTDDEKREVEVVVAFLRGILSHYAARGSEAKRTRTVDERAEMMVPILSAMLSATDSTPGAIAEILEVGRGPFGKAAHDSVTQATIAIRQGAKA